MTAPDVRPEPSRADVERYAEAIERAHWNTLHDRWPDVAALEVLALVAQDRAADAATIEGLRAEVERLRSAMSDASSRAGFAHVGRTLAEADASEGEAALIESRKEVERITKRHIAMTLHDRDLVKEQMRHAEAAESQRDALVAAMERVRALHEMQVEMGVQPWCEADGKPWPCPTITALAAVTPKGDSDD
jgi:hypothetical protein